MSQERIMLVEDEMISRRVVTKALAEHGYQVWHARTGTEAMAMFYDANPDLMVLDLSLINDDPFCSAWDGFGVMGWLRLNYPKDAIPVVVHTVSNSPVIAERAKAAGACAVILKSNPIEALLLTIRAALDARKTSQESDAA